MKHHKLNINQLYIDKFFPKERIKSKAQIIEILMETVRYFLLNPVIAENDTVGTIILHIDKMSRIFYIKDEKFFSIVFPFFTYKEEESFRFSFQNNIDIDSRLISQTISLVKCDEFKEKCSLDFVAPICEYEDCDENFWIFLRELLLMEDGYIRYDYDKKSYDDALEKGEEHNHPLNHYDLFYSNSATFKIGLRDQLKYEEFIDFLNSTTECKYLTNP